MRKPGVRAWGLRCPWRSTGVDARWQGHRRTRDQERRTGPCPQAVLERLVTVGRRPEGCQSRRRPDPHLPWLRHRNGRSADPAATAPRPRRGDFTTTPGPVGLGFSPTRTPQTPSECGGRGAPEERPGAPPIVSMRSPERFRNRCLGRLEDGRSCCSRSRSTGVRTPGGRPCRRR